MYDFGTDGVVVVVLHGGVERSTIELVGIEYLSDSSSSWETLS